MRSTIPMLRPERRPRAFARAARHLALLLCLMLAPGSALALEAVLYLDNIFGSTTIPGRSGGMRVEAYSFTNFRATPPAPSAPAQLSAIRVVKPVDRATPYLLLANAQGNELPNGRLEVFGTDPATPLFTIELQQVRVESVEASGGLSGTREAVGLHFERANWIYNDGTYEEEACFDAFAQTSC